MYYQACISSPVGVLTLLSDGEALNGLWLEGQKYFGSPELAQAVPEAGLECFVRVRAWLADYFDGRRPDFRGIALAPRGTQFQQVIWALLREIPYGQTVTYGQLAAQAAERLGRARSSARAAGRAVGHNPISILIPCHRVVGAGGALTGYAGGLERKRQLLELEGAR